MKSAEEIYGTAVPELPLGVRIIGFGYPKQGDYFLSQTRFESNKSLYPWNESNGPRFILNGPGGNAPTGRFPSRPAIQEIPVRFIVPTPIPTPEAVYHHEMIRIPEGFTKGEFRKIKPGELFLQDGGHSVSTATKDLPTLANGYGYRYVLHPITPDVVYGPHGDGPVIAPFGYTLGEFRKVKPGELFLSNCLHTVTMADPSKGLPSQTLGQGYRYVVTKNSEPKIIRVVRVIEYVGPETWINETLAKSGAGPNGIKGPNVQYRPILAPNRSIRELSIFEEEVKA